MRDERVVPPREAALERAVMIGVAMRDTQRRYFATRDDAALAMSKRLERDFDKAAAEALRGDALL